MEDKSTEGDRKQQLLDAAETLIRERRTLNLSLGELADRVGVSRSLLYVYFDGVPKIIDALFLMHLERLGSRVLPALDASDASYRERAGAAYSSYLDYLIESGPILQLILRERHQDSPLGPDSQRRFRLLLRQVAALTRQALRLAPREAFVLLELTSGIPEALARLVRAGEIDRATAHATCDRLVLAAVDGFAVGPTS
ncbi:TetR/AcrR family transcriptional regulator [Pseudoblastomonas halimionae]|uniref:TetR family transcriptional regulator n=1 Tax=Alteriqipengyuania halimionae TaxID=1926630 RepID=A0A6I4U122_9SPHN|nr:TetR/AcrR family transcriptional regulator [Alteriqipengyuania halimionae]MXP08954.1 TetR family transcriptional regulator [Alteriqipengyuania halimionae]